MSAAVADAARATAGKYLTFRLANEDYGVEILKVQEIIGIMSVTRVPRTPASIRGVINLRGKVIPVVDLRSRFGMPGREDTKRTCFIVVRVQRGGTPIIMGIIVDEVSEVLNVGADQIEPTPAFGAGVETQFILGMGKVGQRVLILLDIDKVLADDELGVVQKIAQAETPSD